MVEDENNGLRSPGLPVPTFAQIEALQAAMIPIQTPLPEPVHHFAPGLYLRELTVPAGMLVVGKIHRREHPIIVLRGKAIIWSEHGTAVLEGGHLAISPPGIKRVALAIEDTTFLTIHANREDSRDLDVIEAEHIEPELMLSGSEREALCPGER